VNGYTVAWILWGLAFVVIEAKAILDGRAGDPGGTLSEHLRLWLGTSRTSSKQHRWLGAGAFVLFILWFTPHILNG
jgi:hypothetical protein